MKFRNLLVSFLIVSLSFFIFLITGCSHHLGYSVLLWNVDDKKIADGTILSVYIKSNISQVYVVSLPDSTDKFEVPLWQITEPQSRKKAEEHSLKYIDYKNKYARVMLDGLPMRAEADNVAKQVYRLRENEIIRVLFKGKGVAPMTGGKAIEGEWLRVLAHDGTTGWCFSHSLELFDMEAGEVKNFDEPEESTVETAEDKTLSRILGEKWYPQIYADLISDKTIDISIMNNEAGFKVDAGNNVITFVDSGVNVSLPYTNITKSANKTYKFEGAGIDVVVRSANTIVVQYTDGNGKPKSYYMVTLKDNVEELVAAEKERRERMYRAILKNGSLYNSSSYGTLTLNADGSFEWKKYNLLVPTLVDKSAKGRGFVEIKYILSPSLKNSWDGVITFHFENMNKDVNFLYKQENNGLRLEDTARSTFNGNIVKSRSLNPLVLFFANSSDN